MRFGRTTMFFLLNTFFYHPLYLLSDDFFRYIEVTTMILSNLSSYSLLHIIKVSNLKRFKTQNNLVTYFCKLFVFDTIFFSKSYMVLRYSCYNCVLRHVLFTKLESDWLLIQKNTSNKWEKDNQEVDRSTSVGTVIIQYFSMKIHIYELIRLVYVNIVHIIFFVIWRNEGNIKIWSYDFQNCLSLEWPLII